MGRFFICLLLGGLYVLDTLKYVKVKGQGAFARVSQYSDDKGKLYAHKTLKPELRSNQDDVSRFRREIAILEALKGEPHIVPIIDSDDTDLWYIMPYAEKNLHEFITKNNQTLTEEERVEIFEKILDGISIAHSKSILHRDITPNNILKIENDWYICDFGLGKDYSKYTQGGFSSVQGYGSYYYAAPEQADKLKDATIQSDVYSLGKIFYFILTGKEPRNINDAPSYLSVIKGAAAERVGDRYDSVPILKNEVLKYKQYYSRVAGPSLQDITVQEYLFMHQSKLRTNQFDWNEFYEITMEFNIKEHVYYDFIDPIIMSLKDDETVYFFYKAINNQKMLDFIVKFNLGLEKCFSNTGWPFNATNAFGYFLNRLFKTLTDPPCQLECLKGLWTIAARYNQWAVQDIILDIIQKNSISKENEREFAVYMIDQDNSFPKLSRVNTTRITSTEISSAISILKKK